MDAASWLSSLAAPAEDSAPEPAAAPAGDGHSEEPQAAEAVVAAEALEESPEDALVALGFARPAVVAALEAAGGSQDEALAALAAAEGPAAKRRRTAEADAGASSVDADLIEVDGVQCKLTRAGELTLHLPLDPETAGPVVGRQLCAGGGIVFEGMDDWLWELHDCHPPRERELPASFDEAETARRLDAGDAHVWDGFAEEAEVVAAHEALEAMFQRGSLTRGSSAWVDECSEGGHAMNRSALAGQRRGDACGFWDIRDSRLRQGPPPPPPILEMFRRLEGAAARLRKAHGWPLLCSRLGMGAVYDGRGAAYSQHRDNEWQRHLRPRLPAGVRRRAASLPEDCPGKGAWMNFREITMLAYVNPPGRFDEDEAGKKEGGRLRCYVDTRRGDLVGSTATSLKDVAPIGGRAVVFRSRELLHEVLPAYGRRYCLTLWFCTADG